jgi:hypothetical protein
MDRDRDVITQANRRVDEMQQSVAANRALIDRTRISDRTHQPVTVGRWAVVHREPTKIVRNDLAACAVMVGRLEGPPVSSRWHTYSLYWASVPPVTGALYISGHSMREVLQTKAAAQVGWQPQKV